MLARLPWLLIWSTAFGVLEAAVVVHLRRLCYPDQPPGGPLYPMPPIEPLVMRAEQVREAATLLMLLGVAFLAERRPVRRFAAFAFCFGVWDLVYYLALAALIGWPVSLMDWDILFLIPAPWASPVLAPVLVSLALVGCSAALLRRVGDAGPSPMRPRDWWALSLGGALILASFFRHGETELSLAEPRAYPWWLFFTGWLGGLGWFIARMRAARA